jgi:hypothetical protein
MIEHGHLPERTTPRGLMGALIRCSCGHDIGAHSRAGCSIGVYSACSCRLTDGEALNLAIKEATEPPKP